ncbi:MAG: hypothetical protein ACFNLP_08810, partial [Segatella oulorum]
MAAKVIKKSLALVVSIGLNPNCCAVGLKTFTSMVRKRHFPHNMCSASAEQPFLRKTSVPHLLNNHFYQKQE